jgi:hypothetical protein
VTEPDDLKREEGGEAACYAHLICPQCATVLDGSDHAVGCPWVFEDPVTSPVE